MNNNFIEEETSKTGDKILKYKNIYLHSKYDPKIEAVRFVEKNYKKSSIQLLIGYGAGYIYEELKRTIEIGERILVIDPIIHIDKNENFLTDLSMDSIKEFLNSQISITDTLNVIVGINYDKITSDSKDMLLFYKMLNEKIVSNKINENTVAHFIKQWNENYLKNLKYAKNDPSIKALFGSGTEPIVIASGGPSLTKQLPLIKKYRKQIILIAAGTTINSLLKNDIRPDLVVAIDGGIANYNHFKDLQIDDFPLVYVPTNHFGIRDRFKYAYSCFITMEEQLIPHYKKYSTKQPETFIGGSSVANVAYNLALFMTNGPITLIGQDLAYTNGQTHAEGNLGKSEVTKNNTLMYEGYFGELVETDSVFLQMRDGFENIVKTMQSENRSFNSTEGGLKIPSFKQLEFERFLEDYANKEVDFKAQYDIEDIDQEFLLGKYNNDMNVIEKINRLCNDGLSILKQNISTVEFSSKTLKKLDKIDEKIQLSMKETSIEYAYLNITLHLIKYFSVDKNEAKEVQYEIAYKQSEYMYEEMIRISNESLSILKDLVKEIGD